MKARAPHFQSCNVLEVTAEGRRLWQFSVGKDSLKATGDLRVEPGQTLPKKLVAKEWQTLIRPRLDLGWLPAEHAFIRAVQLPSADAAELPGMVEFQLEKISPLPVTHIVWVAEGIPHPDGKSQTALVTIAPRDRVETVLRDLATDGYVADAFDVAILRELRGVMPAGDSVWVLVESQVTSAQALVGWFVGGVWRDVSLFQLPVGAVSATTLVRCLNQTAWAGELDGWLAGLPPVQVRVRPEEAAGLATALQAWSGQPVQVEARADRSELAAASAQARLKANPTALVPDEVSARQRAAFVDRVWMRSLGGVFMTYLLAVFVYLGVLNWKKYQLDELKGNAVGLARQYTNTIQIREQVAVLQEQVGLKFAALDVWQAAVEELPPSLTLTRLDFKKGQQLDLTGTVPADSQSEVTTYSKKLQAAKANQQLLFSKVAVERVDATRAAVGGATWTIKAELKKVEAP
jgi:hypothetical protein